VVVWAAAETAMRETAAIARGFVANFAAQRAANFRRSI
jgi:hypothetical protein